MDKFVIRTKPGLDVGQPGPSKNASDSKSSQFKKQLKRSIPVHRPKTTLSRVPQAAFCSSAVSNANRLIDSTLKDPSNPITHNDGYKRAHHVVSSSTGHQQSNGRSASSSSKWQATRNAKLKAQAKEAENTTLKDVVIYINGYTGQVTNQQLIAMVLSAGGQVRRIMSGSCTHVVTAMPLSGSKTEKELLRKRSGVPIVRPEWVIESIRAGKRQAEWKYPVMEHDVILFFSLLTFITPF
ncbi:hypothetical protein CROQUDRAFT_208884 [Cronartium quercuum f. sp. fusiforme G11]|uniref:BRCT domain-containing protein n=1 Tax=Cronartium quercuum f. sp. fusiforme G11 TaxID=708437 RepID=A0A9P6T8B0_9BASI|nr:hypothetical protein CROQUDRAFT_208884 [Cronartium quercuum f. sp. fusiforme G11]